jgi:hypothetical protein
LNIALKSVMEKIIPTWGYKSDGTAKIFDLEEGENLPEGWSDRPEPWHHPNTAHLYKRPEGRAKEVNLKEPSTIEELEAILNSEDDRQVYINPDGTITHHQEAESIELNEAPKPRRGRPRKSEIS